MSRPHTSSANRRTKRTQSAPSRLKAFAKDLPLRQAGYAAAAILVVGMGVGVYQLGSHAYKSLSAGASGVVQKAGFSLTNIVVEGRSRTRTQDISQTMAVKKGMPIFDVDPHLIREKLEALPWVRSVVVERRLPNTLYIRLMERSPIALWQDQKTTHFLVDERGEIIHQADASDHRSFLIVTGEKAPEATPLLLKTLEKYPQIAQHVTGAAFVSSRAWELHLGPRLRVKLPARNLDQAMVRLQEFAKAGYFEKADILSIDVRLPDRAFFYLSDAATARRKGGPKAKVGATVVKDTTMRGN
ncbi:MAG: FtsQ-type POTRA domain-containing protein [Proteobacteria bacterium]|nr:FtsQ-type POTRA domain-containing protein [Pseudomonadota bacterium]